MLFQLIRTMEECTLCGGVKYYDEDLGIMQCESCD